MSMPHGDPPATPSLRLVVVTGLSGSGKSTALRALEDLGFFCIDNLPVVLLPRLLELSALTREEVRKFALVVDAREGGYLDRAPEVLEDARRAGHHVHVLFLEASDETLLRRYSETRRRHPLSPEGPVAEGIARERALLQSLREVADESVDTSELTVHQLKQLVQDRFAAAPGDTAPVVTVMSFGFKHGLPPQADLLFDVRFLPNPHFVDALRPKSGLDAEVATYVLNRPETETFLTKVEDLLRWLLPLYERERKSYLTVAIGCTGGRHRSVAVAERLVERLAAHDVETRVRHRDVDRS